MICQEAAKHRLLTGVRQLQDMDADCVCVCVHARARFRCAVDLLTPCLWFGFGFGESPLRLASLHTQDPFEAFILDNLVPLDLVGAFLSPLLWFC